jgi:cell wall-associated NlpC family hydrolase
VWGGESPSGFDCSGLVMYAYAKVGIAIPHSVAKQYARGTPVSKRDLQPGDLVFFDRLRHNGIYIGGSEFIHAGRSGRAVRISRLDEDWFKARWVGARRL